MKNSVIFELIQHFDPLFSLVEEAFKNRIGELYNYKCSTLQKFKELDDRSCEVMFVDHKPVGFLIYKKSLQREFDLNNAFELKTLFVFRPEQNERRGLGSLLFNRAYELATLRNASYLYSTVVASNHAMISCALKNGFKIAKRGKELTKSQREHHELEENELVISKLVYTPMDKYDLRT